MELLRLVMRYAHLVGFALLLGGAIAQYLTGRLRINSAMLWGAIVQLVTGLVLAAPLRGGGDDEPAPAKLAVKLVLAAAIFAMVFFSRRRDQVSQGHFLATVALTLVNAAVATFWR
ncbi:hypothetical protein [Pilimelia columellifera]|uniref:hypothetical protein n=1 Tax=Pilimelia columellifera TaxID=706574 RepID=UPI0031DDBA5E